MKRSVITLAVTVAFLAILVAPGIAQTKLTLGFKGGLNIANISHEHIDDTDYRTGVGFGAYLSFDISPTVSIQPELLYMQKGGKAKDIPAIFEVEGYLLPQEGSIDIEAKVNYLEIPVLVKFMVPTQSATQPFFFGGPALAIKLSAENEIDWRVVGLSGSEAEDADDDMKSTDFGFVRGGGVDFPVGQGFLGIEGRYTYGLVTVDSDNDGEEEDVKSRTFSIMLAYSFPVGAK